MKEAENMHEQFISLMKYKNLKLNANRAKLNEKIKEEATHMFEAIVTIHMNTKIYCNKLEKIDEIIRTMYPRQIFKFHVL